MSNSSLLFSRNPARKLLRDCANYFEQKPSVFLVWILIIVGILRILTAWVSLGFDHPNEIYRLLEPLALLSGYSANPPWEWTEKLLSQLPVLAHLKILQLASITGITSALAQVRLLHILYGLLSLSQIYCTWRLVRLATRSWVIAGAAALGVGLWPEFVYQSVRLMDYSLEASFLAIAVLLIFGDLPSARTGKLLKFSLKRQRALFAALGGFFLGLLFFVRYQSGLHLITFCMVLIWEACGNSPDPRKKTQRPSDSLTRLLFCVLIYGLTVGVLAWIEAPNFSAFLLPFRNYIHFNWTLNGAEKLYGAVPWHRYFSEIAKFFGVFPFFLLSALALLETQGRKLFLIAFFPVLIHSMISHKEGRFIFGCLFLWVPAAFCAFKTISDSNAYARTIVQGLKKHWITLGFFLVLSFGISLYRTTQRLTLRASEVTSFAQAGTALSALHRSSLFGDARLTIATDPVHSPGAFFLRWKGELCYEFEKQATCLAEQNLTKKTEHFYFIQNSSKILHPQSIGRSIWTNSLWSVFSNRE